MSMLNVALLQMASHGHDQSANAAKAEDFCRKAAALGADVAVFPEMWNVGYRFFDPREPGARERWAALAVDPEGDYAQRFRALARELNMAIALTYLERWPGAPRNTVTLIDRHGEPRLTYAKVHTCDWDVESALTPGDDFHVCALDTATGAVQVGAMICYDREFPESARILMLKGAEVILTPNACGLERHRLDQFKTRAYENMLGVAMANYAAPQENGHSVAFDGVAFDHEGHSRDMLAVEAGEAEGVYMARFDLDRLRAYRQSEVWGDAYRHPSRYNALTAADVRAPFARATARR
jgi:N-carbamoylputrescine amidase